MIVSSSEGEVMTQKRMFCVADARGEPDPGHPDWPYPVQGELVTVFSGTALFMSAIEDNLPFLEIEHWDTEPPWSQGDWEVRVSKRLKLAGGLLKAWGWVSVVLSDHHLEVPPGNYWMRVYCRGRDAVRRSDGIFPHSVERWLVQLWAVGEGDRPLDVVGSASPSAASGGTAADDAPHGSPIAGDHGTTGDAPIEASRTVVVRTQGSVFRLSDAEVAGAPDQPETMRHGPPPRHPASCLPPCSSPPFSCSGAPTTARSTAPQRLYQPAPRRQRRTGLHRQRRTDTTGSRSKPAPSS